MGLKILLAYPGIGIAMLLFLCRTGPSNAQSGSANKLMKSMRDERVDSLLYRKAQYKRQPSDSPWIPRPDAVPPRPDSLMFPAIPIKDTAKTHIGHPMH